MKSERAAYYRAIRLRKIGFRSYAEYLDSPLWRSIRSEQLRNQPDCNVCGARATQVHHRSYGYNVLLGRNLKPLTSLCSSCHYMIEFEGSGRKRCLARANGRLKWFLKHPGWVKTGGPIPSGAC